MKKFVQKLRNKSEEERKRILTLSLIIVMVLIGGLWINSLTHRFTPKVAKETKSDLAPFKLLGARLGGTFKNVTASVNEAKVLKKKTKDAVNEELQNEKVINLIPVDR